MIALLLVWVALLMPAGAARADDALPGTGMTRLAGIEEEVVLAGSRIRGGRLDLTRFVDARTAPVVLEAVRRAWSRRPAPIRQATRAGWFTLTQAVGTSLEILEVRESSTGRGVEGRRSRWHREPGATMAGLDRLQAALPAGSQVVDRISHQDGTRQMTTIVAVTNGGAEAQARALVSALARQGFRSRDRTAWSFPQKGLAFFLARGREDLAVTVSEHAGRRAIVLHWGRMLR